MYVDWDSLLSRYPISPQDFDPATELEAAEFFLVEFRYLNHQPSATQPINRILESQQSPEIQLTRHPSRSTNGYQIVTENAAPAKVLRGIVTCPPAAIQTQPSTSEHDEMQVLFHGGPIAKENNKKVTKRARIGILRKTVTYQSKC